MKNGKKPSNIKTALILFSIALVFFVGVIVKQSLR
ncbi:MAG: cytochrome oxidase small assembly protein [Pseudomonadota bacterium]